MHLVRLYAGCACMLVPAVRTVLVRTSALSGDVSKQLALEATQGFLLVFEGGYTSVADRGLMREEMICGILAIEGEAKEGRRLVISAVLRPLAPGRPLD